jgi:glucose-6-phosphate dehydrogenase assembly protein OpcA
VSAAAEGPALGPLTPAALEAELGRLWRQEQAAEHAPEAAPVVAHARLVTLLVHAPDAEAAESARELARALSQRHPGRWVVLEVRPGQAATDAVEARAALFCPPAEAGRRHACGEIITLAAAGAGTRRLPGAALALLLPNLPAVLWWQRGSPVGQALFADLRIALDRLLVDSLTFDRPAQSLAELASHLDDDPVPVSDLSWARLAPWRYHTARLYDGPDGRPHLDALNTITIRLAPGPRLLAWLYAGWVASRLGWQPAGGDAGEWRFAQGQVVRFETGAEVPAGMHAGCFMGVTLESGATRFDLARHGQACVARRFAAAPSAAGAWQMEHVASLRADQPITWLGHELVRAGRVPVYEAALRLAAAALSF